MNRVLTCAAVAMSAVIMTSSRADAAVVNITVGSTSGYTMTDGNTYVIRDSVSFSNSTVGGSGMTVEDGATVVIFVPSNVTLTARGANGSGQTGGGAGILVPETATLIITGEGTVNATGGNAGNGGDGTNGDNGGQISVTANSGYGTGAGGAGGTGGAGGGGAGNGIGGFGGSGGVGGAGATSVQSKVNAVISTDQNEFWIAKGNDGSVGEPGKISGSMGNVYCIGAVCIVCAVGLSGNNGAAGECGAITTYTYTNYQYYKRVFATCGGGGGGGGGGGSSPTLAIGGGGKSGGGGGGGGGGPFDGGGGSSAKVYNVVFGGGGLGGGSDVSVGSSGTAANTAKCVTHTISGGDGGAGGAAGAEGDAGTLYVSPTATVDVDREKLPATTHPAAQYTITFNANGGQFLSAVDSLTATLGCELPDCIPTPTRRGYLFDGWCTMTGEEYYGTSGTKSISSYPIADNVILYAQWHWDDNVDYTVTTPEPVPYSYFDTTYPTLLAEYGGDYESAALATAANGYNRVWECYVAGISPTNETARFTAAIELKNGVPVVTWEPDLNTNGVIRTYKVYGSETLDNGGEWQYPTNSLHRFFKVKVEMP